MGCANKSIRSQLALFLHAEIFALRKRATAGFFASRKYLPDFLTENLLPFSL